MSQGDTQDEKSVVLVNLYYWNSESLVTSNHYVGF